MLTFLFYLQFKGNKECALLVCGADEKENFDGIVKTYEIMADYLGWTNRGVVIAPEVSEKGAIEGSAALTESKELGERM